MSQLFHQLLASANSQSQAQRLLFLFAKIDESEEKDSQTRGTISPVMCVDKLPTELSDFETLVAEADSVAPGWDFVFISGLSGENNKAPSTDDAEPYLNKMTNDVASGQDLSRYMILDRQQQQIHMSQGENP